MPKTNMTRTAAPRRRHAETVTFLRYRIKRRSVKKLLYDDVLDSQCASPS